MNTATRDALYLFDWGSAGTLAYRPRSGWARLLRGAKLGRLLRGRQRGAEPSGRAGLVPDRQQTVTPPFRPNCLTLWLGGSCPLDCTYCFARQPAARAPGVVPPLPAVTAAAQLVAQGARRTGRPFVLALHGGCEPLSLLDPAGPAIDAVLRVAARWHLRVQLHAATGGVISEAALDWAAARLHSVTLSWDGDALAHDAQRPRHGGGGSHADVTAALGRFAASGQLLRLRATVTAASLAALPQAVAGLQRDLGEGVLRRTTLLPEPVYPASPGLTSPVAPPDPEGFTRTYLRLLRQTRPNGLRLEFAACRPNGSAHGRHCAFWQRNLVLDPGGGAVGCLLPSMLGATRYGGERALSAGDPGWRLEPSSLAALRSATSRTLSRCEACFVADRCSRGCPTSCPLKEAAEPDPATCLRNRRVGLAHLLQRAQGHLSEADVEALFERVGLPPDRSVPAGAGSWP